MAKLTLELEVDFNKAHVEKYKKDYFPKPDTISLDEAYLTRSEDDDSFFDFKFVKIEWTPEELALYEKQKEKA